MALTGSELAETEKFHPQNNEQAYLAYALGLLTDPDALPEPKTIEQALLKQYCLNGGSSGDDAGGDSEGEEEEDAGFSAYAELLARSSKTLQVLDGITTIGENACYMAAFTEVSLPESVVSIGTNAFYQNKSLSNIQIMGPAKLGASCFAVDARNKYRTDVLEMPEVVEIGDGAFNNRMLAFTDLDLPKCKTIGASAFKESWGTYGKLATVNAPECETIGASAFYSATCNKVITRNLKTIGSEAFRYSGVKTFIMAGNQVATLQNANAFSNINGGTYFYVPLELMGQYKSATNWTTYAEKFLPIVATVGDLAGIDGAIYARAYVDAVDCIYVYDGAAWSKEGA